MSQRLDARVPRLLLDLAQVAAAVDVAVRQHNLRRHARRREHLRQQRVRVQRNGPQQLIQRVGAKRRIRSRRLFGNRILRARNSHFARRSDAHRPPDNRVLRRRPENRRGEPA